MPSQTTYAILGAARSGLAAARLLRAEGASVLVSDVRSEEESDEAVEVLREIGAEYEFGGHTDRVLERDVLVLSPGVPDTIPIVRRAVERGIAVTNEIDIAAARSRGKIVAITGTNGKTTTTELTGHILRGAGLHTFVAGNVGTPFSAVAEETKSESVTVLELSSFQLEHINALHPDVAVVLNITPDHLDRYESIEAYAAAKMRITGSQTAHDALLYNADDERIAGLVEQSSARLIGFSLSKAQTPGAWVEGGAVHLTLSDSSTQTLPTSEEEIMIQVDSIRIRGPHNLYNAMAAALAARSLGVGADAIREGLESFPGVPHRLEPVREVNGVRYVNDSKATNVDALWYALHSFNEPIVLIAGGRSKKNDYETILPLVRDRVRAMVLIGEAAEEMAAAFSSSTRILRAGFDMKEAVQLAHDAAERGDVVLLSPACASFDMFRNYEHRGDVFKQTVQEL